MGVDTPRNVLARILIRGEVRAKKNSRSARRSGGRTYTVAGKAHQEWHAGAMEYLALHRRSNPFLYAPQIISIRVDLWRKTLGHYDPDNMLTSVLDALVDAYVIETDGFSLVHWTLARHMGKDAQNPRAEVTIYAGNDGPEYVSSEAST